jgi:sRNA-binding carbon storage regulator CsrA
MLVLKRNLFERVYIRLPDGRWCVVDVKKITPQGVRLGFDFPVDDVMIVRREAMTAEQLATAQASIDERRG